MFKNNVTPLERLQLGSSLCEGLAHGEVTALASNYQVSRWFLYDCKNLVKGILSTQFSKKTSSSTCESPLYLLVKRICSLYLNCHSSLKGICSCLSDLFDSSKTRGFVSGLLNEIGSCLSSIDCIPKMKDCKGIKICVLGDELYLNGLPILGVVDASSNYLLGLLLSDQCDGDSWGYFWLCLTDGNTCLLDDLACDLGSGLQKSLKEYLKSTNFHYDLFHYLRPLARIPSKESQRIEQKWKGLLSKEEELAKHLRCPDLRVASNLAPESVKHQSQLEALNTKTQTYQKGIEEQYIELDRLIDREIAIKELMFAIRSCLQIVDKNGSLNKYESVQQNLLFYIDYGIEIIAHEPLTKALNKLKNHYLGAIHYFKQLPEIETQLQEKIPQQDSRAILLIIWQLDQAIRSAKDHKIKQKKKKQKQSWQNLLIEQMGEEVFEKTYQSLRTSLQFIIRSSSMMENLNGRIRVFADAARGQLNQNRLNLIRFFLNHSLLDRTECEERKGYSPYQLFMDKKEDKRHWFDILWEDYLKVKLPRIIGS